MIDRLWAWAVSILDFRNTIIILVGYSPRIHVRATRHNGWDATQCRVCSKKANEAASQQDFLANNGRVFVPPLHAGLGHSMPHVHDAVSCLNRLHAWDGWCCESTKCRQDRISQIIIGFRKSCGCKELEENGAYLLEAMCGGTYLAGVSKEWAWVREAQTEWTRLWRRRNWTSSTPQYCFGAMRLWSRLCRYGPRTMGVTLCISQFRAWTVFVFQCCLITHVACSCVY